MTSVFDPVYDYLDENLGRCQSCNVPLVNHLGLFGTCAELSQVSGMLFHALRRVKEEGQYVVDGVIDQAMEEWFQGYVEAMGQAERSEYESHLKFMESLARNTPTQPDLPCAELIEARKEIERLARLLEGRKRHVPIKSTVYIGEHNPDIDVYFKDAPQRSGK